MIVYRRIQIHPKGCGWWIIIMGFRVLLTIHYLIQEILVKGVLDVHTRDVKIKKISRLRYYNDAFSIKKGSWRNTCVDNVILPWKYMWAFSL